MAQRRTRVLTSMLTLAIAALLMPITLTATANAQQPATAFDCTKDVLLLGAAGSGENPNMNWQVGKTVSKLFDEVNAVVEKQGRTSQRVAVNYPAYGVPDTLLVNPGEYFNGVRAGITEAVRILDDLSKTQACAHQRVVLGGYSQGSMVMHRALRELGAAGRDDILNRIDGVVMVADPDRLPNDNVTSIGGAPANAHGISNDYPFEAMNFAKINPTWRSKVMSVCIKGDPVCGLTYLWTPLAVASYVPLHLKYAESGFTKYLSEAAKKIKFKFPSDAIVFDKSIPTTVTSAAWQLVKHQLSATTGPNCTIAWSATGKLPPGLQIDNKGYISGFPTTAGKTSTTIKMSTRCHNKNLTATVKMNFVITPKPPVAEADIVKGDVKLGECDKRNFTPAEIAEYGKDGYWVVVDGADQIKKLGYTITDNVLIFTGCAKKVGVANYTMAWRNPNGELGRDMDGSIKTQSHRLTVAK